MKDSHRGRAIALVCLAAAVSLLGQSDTAVLFGLVKDPTGTGVGNGTVRIRSLENNSVREMPTDSRGLFYFTTLPPGGYELTVELSGFKQYRNSSVSLQVGQVGRLDVKLELGSVTQFEEVSDAVSILTSETSTQGTVLSREKIAALPLNGRQFLQLVMLAPGANPGGRAVQQNTLRQGQTGGLSVAGGRTNNTAFLLDGVVNIDPDYNSLNYSPTVDAVAEFQVQTAMTPAEFGRSAVNVVTKSGSDEIHGAAWEFLRNRALDSRPFNLPSSLPQYQRNQFGGVIGAPIVRKKLFGFAAFEGLRVRQAGGGLTSVAVPSALQREGDFSATRGGIFDPDTLANGVRQPFAGNVIPANRIHPWSRAAINALPLPNDPSGTYVNAAGLLRQTNDNVQARVDYNATQKLLLFGRYSTAGETAVLPQTLPNRDSLNDGRPQNVAFGSTYVISSRMVNETKLGFSRLRLLSGVPEIPFQVGGVDTRLPQMNVAGYPLFGGAGGFNTTNAGGGVSLVRNNVFQIYDNLSWNIGKHAVKFGAEVAFTQYNRFEAANVTGSFQFTNGFTTRTARNDGTGDALASYLLALPAIGSRSDGPSRIDGRQRSFSGYFQDDWRIRSNVTINLGLRYELAPPMYDARQQMSSIDYSKVPNPGEVFQSGKTGFYKPTLFVCGQSGYPRGCAFTDKNNFAPRVGVAWTVNPKTVVRAGGGVFYANTDANPLFRLAAGLPSNIAQTLNSDNFVPRFKGFDIFGPAVVGSAQLQAAGIDLYQRTSYSLQWTLSIQRQLSKNIVLEVGYLATAGLKLEQNVQPNNALPGTGAVDPRRPYLGVVYAPGTQFPPYLSVSGDSVPVGFINYLPHSAQSNYHSGFIRLEKRYDSGLSFLTAFTWSKAITNAPQFRNAGGVTGSENSPAQDSFNLAAERGLAPFHTGRRLVNSFVYQLPFGKGRHWAKEGWASRLAGGLDLSGIFALQDGFPFTINLRGDTAGVGAGTGGIFIRPNLAPGASYELSSRTTDRWFNTAAFVAPPVAAFGNIGRNTVIGPGLVNLDLSLGRTFHVGERFTLQFRAESFNSFNHPNYNIVGRILNDPTFGRVQSQLDPRQIQLGLRLGF